MNSAVGIGFACIVLLAIVVTCASTIVRVPDEDADPWKSVPVPPIKPQETDPQFWRNQALGTLNDKITHDANKNKAKNIIFFLGDGMSVATVTAARIYQGQLNNRTGEENKLSFENFSHTGLSKTYCTDKQVPDSASTATAYMCGVKANFQTIGVSAKVEVVDCDSGKIEANRVTSIVQWAQEAGKATGVVTNTRVTHASPAGAYAHVPFRGMESDADIKHFNLDPKSCDYDIAKQLVHDKPGRDIKVILGGGRTKFLTTAGSTNGQGEREDADLVADWLKDKISRKANAAYVRNADQLKQIDPSKTEYLFGLFADSHLKYHLENETVEPTLSEMTEKAIQILQKEKNGFYLFVEGGKIDMAHHEAQARMALDETIEFSKAVQKAYDLTSEQDTLIVVTADHAHTMTINGYPNRGYDILGIFGKSNDTLPYTTLSYANGPGYHPENSNHTRYNLEHDHLDRWDYRFPSMVPKTYESHGGDDVPVYASGPWSHLFSGSYEQNFIPLAKAYAAHIGPSSSKPSYHNATSSLKASFSMLSILFSFLLCVHSLNFTL